MQLRLIRSTVLCASVRSINIFRGALIKAGENMRGLSRAHAKATLPE